jgi:hypothetical protein
MPADPNAPKGALTAYFAFMTDRKSALMAENPTWKFTDVGKKCGELWKTVDDATKEKYMKQAEADRERYNKEMAEYKKTDAYQEGVRAAKAARKAKLEKKAKRKVKAKKPLQDLAQKYNKPKRPMNELFTFMNEVRATIQQENPAAKLGDITKIGMEMWSKADAATKKRIADKITKQQEDFKVQMAAWEASDDYANYNAEARKTRQDVRVQNAVLAKDAAKVATNFSKDLKGLATTYAKPKKPVSTYFMFIDEVREQICAESPGAKGAFGKVSQIATKMWEKIDKTVAMPRLEAKKRVLDYEYFKAMEAWEASEEGKKYAEESAAIQEDKREACANANANKANANKLPSKRGRPSKSNTVAEPPKKKRQIIDD